MLRLVVVEVGKPIATLIHSFATVHVRCTPNHTVWKRSFRFTFAIIFFLLFSFFFLFALCCQRFDIKSVVDNNKMVFIWIESNGHRVTCSLLTLLFSWRAISYHFLVYWSVRAFVRITNGNNMFRFYFRFFKLRFVLNWNVKLCNDFRVLSMCEFEGRSLWFCVYIRINHCVCKTSRQQWYLISRKRLAAAKNIQKNWRQKNYLLFPRHLIDWKN